MSVIEFNREGALTAQLTKSLMECERIYDKTYDEELLDFFKNYLDKYEAGDIKKAFKIHILSSHFFPKPVDIMRIIEKNQRHLMMQKIFGELVPEVLDYEAKLKVNNFPDWAKFFKNIIYCPCKLIQIKQPARKLFVYAILEKMGRHTGGMSYFWHKEEDKDSILKGWMDVFEELSAEKIIRTVCLILDGKYKNKLGQLVPKNSVDFKDFWTEIAQNSPPLFEDPKPEPVALIGHDKEGVKKLAEEAMEQARAWVKKMRGHNAGKF